MILTLIISFVLLEFAVNSVLSWLNGRWMTHPIPAVLKGLYDEAKYQKQQEYMRTCRRVSWVSRCVSLAIILPVLACGWLGWLDGVVKTWTDSPLLQLLILYAIFDVVGTLLDLPFGYYSTFVVEERFGFNKTTKRTFWLDTLKATLLSLAISTALLTVIFLLYQSWGDRFWLWALLVYACVMAFFNLFYSNIIVPLFNKQRKLEPGELRTALETAMGQWGARFDDIYVIDGSKHSTKANAYFTGFGPKKRIVLYDTLLEQLATDQVVGVMAHEYGHYKHHDTLRNLVVAIVTIGVYLYLFSLVVGSDALPQALGGTPPSFALAMIAFSLLLTPLGFILSPIKGHFSRRAEYRADAFAAEHGHGESLIEGLKRLAANNLSNLTPHPAVVWFTYSHPTLAQRITQIKQLSHEV